MAVLGIATVLVSRIAPLSFFDTQVLQDSLALLVVTALVSAIGAGSTSNALQATRQARQIAEKSAADLERANAVLELRVTERTHELRNTLTSQQAQATQLQASLERQQTLNDLLNALSLPIIPINADVLVAPLVGNLDTWRAEQLIDRVLGEIEMRRARAVIIDVTGVAIVDTNLAQVLVRTAEATRLLGAQIILAGIRPEVAQTLVSLGVDLSGLRTVATLQEGLIAVS
jgi:anti-anti-sigma factor